MSCLDFISYQTIDQTLDNLDLSKTWTSFSDFYGVICKKNYEY